ncbi:hypothetical protein HBI25_221940 [Parastagonospora nodorum]|nr:hypothetical protein HBI06_238000 [Parastagonospora nodorum]KAH4226589.1 hypothetical protein HBI05_217930 [Parastagonospora nodorum]KAH4474878.1 hypothetical protein HBH88_233630 [Parastagonospora nodorum]KAH4649802.1 hypothetical protein HBH80_224030 [Parastagonospora nodorum]KAH4716529.1 hypothetical protein HBH66_228250 [Parastagonospora nodorum]
MAGNNRGRSKGCKTCLRRHVKCDQIRPTCLRCSKGKFECLGYRETLFIDGREQVLRRLNSTQNLYLQKTTSGSLEYAQDYQTSLHFSNDDEIHDAGVSQPQVPLSLSPMREAYFVSYLIANDEGPMKVFFRDLLLTSHQDPLQKSVKEQCSLAFATTFFGVGHAQRSLIDEGRRLYLQALGAVNAILRDPTRSRSIEALGSVVTLCLYEAIAPTRSNEHTWMHHMNGLEQLFAMQGPVSVKSNPSSSALLDVTRPTMIVAALYARRPSLMSRPEWSAVTMHNPTEGGLGHLISGLDYLMDALAQISVLYHVRDKFVEGEATTDSGGANAHLESIQALLDRALSIREDVSTQRNRWTAARQDSESLTIPCGAVPSTQPHPCSVVTQFSSLEAANASTFYNAVLIMINQFIVSVHALLPLHDAQATALTLSSEQISVAVTDILMSIDYHLPFTDPAVASASGTSGPRNIYLLLPLRIAHRALSQSESPEDVSRRLWLEDVMSVIRSRAMPWMSNEQIFGAR